MFSLGVVCIVSSLSSLLLVEEMSRVGKQETRAELHTWMYAYTYLWIQCDSFLQNNV